MKYIPPHLQERIQEAKDKQLKELDLSNNFGAHKVEKLVQIPADVCELNQLQRNNKLTTLPESVSKLTNLTSLNLSGNNLKTLPESFGELTNLTSLGLSNNQLTKLPESVDKLTNLTSLDVNNNKLTKLPESFGELTNLTSLDLRNNQLT